jgi:uncharacterized protein YwgA
MGVGSMSKCQCDLRTKLVGDGCRYCNAQEYIDKLIESLEELIESLEEQRTWVGLTDEEVTWLCNTAKSHEQTWGMFVRAIETKLKEKNT